MIRIHQVLRLLLTAALISLCHGAQAQNLVTNGDFESGVTNGWNHLAGDGGVATYSGITVGAYDGTSLQAQIDTLGSNPWSVQSLGPSLTLTNGQSYILSFYGRASVDTTSVKIVLQNSAYAEQSFSLTTEWQRYSWTFTAGEENPSVRIQYLAVATYQLDMISVIPSTPAASSNLLYNGDFERGIADGWTNLAQDGGVARYKEVTSAAYAGVAMEVQVDTSGANSWSIQSLGSSVALTNGEEYRLTFYGKASIPGTQVRMVVQDSVYLAQSFALTGDWAEYSWTFTAQEASPSVRIQYPELGVFWIDSVSVAAVNPGTPPPAGNLVDNGNFEQGFDNGWTHLAQDGASAAYSAIMDYDGTSLQTVVSVLGTNPWSIQSLGPTLILTPGEEYTLTFDGKSLPSGGTLKMVIQNTQYMEQAFVMAGDWAEYTWTFTAQENSPSIRIQFPELGTFSIDNIAVVPVQTQVDVTTLTLDPASKYQEMVGFGAALSWYSAWPFYGSKSAEIMDIMFQDLGIDILRLKNWYYPQGYPNNTAPQNMAEQDSFNAAKWYFDAAKAANPNIKVLLSSWTPPEYLKSNSNLVGGTLASDGSGFMYDEFAQYWVDVLDNLGWYPDYLSFQNEPGYVATWESCAWRPTEADGLPGYDQASEAIWNAIQGRPQIPMMIGPEVENIGQAGWDSSLNSFREFATPLKTQPWIGAYAYHIYDIYNSSQIDGSISRLNMVRDEFGDRPNFMTEYSKEDFDWIDSAVVIHNTVVEANASAYVYWKLLWNASPDTMIAVTSSGDYAVMPHYYTIKHFSKHVDKGYRRIGISGGDGFVKASAYLRPDGKSATVVVINRGTLERSVVLGAGASGGTIATAYQSSEGGYYADLGSVSLSTPLSLPGESITTLVVPVNYAPGGGSPSQPVVGPIFQSIDYRLFANTESFQRYHLNVGNLLKEPIEYSVIGVLPKGLKIADGELQGVTPTTGTYSFTVRLVSGADQLDLNFVIEVIPPTLHPLFTSMSLNGATHSLNVLTGPSHTTPAETEVFVARVPVNSRFELVPSWDFIKPPFGFILAGGTLPDGVLLNRQTGVISGAPTVAGTYTFVLSVKDWRGRGFQWVQLIVE